jgi:hypothetical protein
VTKNIFMAGKIFSTDFKRRQKEKHKPLPFPRIKNPSNKKI